MKVLNLYAGIGGNRKLWEDVEVTAIELNPEIAEIYHSFFPNDEVIVTDAHQYLLDHYEGYDFIWSSPPCQTHSRMSHINHARGQRVYPNMKLWQEIIYLQSWCKKKWVVENVRVFYNPLIKPQEVGRHYFWANFKITPFKLSRDFNTTNTPIKNQITQMDHLDILENHHGIKLPKETKRKRTLLKNCVYPPLGQHILNCGRGNTQMELSVYTKQLRTKIGSSKP